MKSGQYAFRIFIIALAFESGVLAVLFYPFELSKQNVTIDVNDRRYACGDCYVSFGISRIDGNDDSGNRSTSPNRFDGWDILVLFKGSDTYLSSYQNELFSIDPDCAWPTFRLTGQFKRRLIYALLYNGDRFDGIYFDANFGVAIQKPTCKSVPKKTVLP